MKPVFNDELSNGEATNNGARRDADELTHRLRQQELVAAFGVFALRSPDEGALLDEAVRVAAQGVGTPFAKVLRHRPAREDLLLCSGIGWSPDRVGTETFDVDDGSPAGFAFLTGEVVRCNDLEAETRFRTPPLLRDHDIQAAVNVPIDVDDERFGILEVDSREKDRFSAHDRTFMSAVANTLGVALAREGVRRALVETDERQRVLAGELRHRIKNLFSVVYALIGISEREAARADDLEGGFEALRNRIMALSHANDVGTRDASAGPIGSPFDILELSRTVLAPYDGRIDVTGSALAVNERWSSPIGLVLHELATNASKHGALASAQGRIVLEWSRDADGVVGHWRETGGTLAPKPKAAGQGFGTRMIDMVLTQADGTIERDWGGNGLVATLRLPIKEDEPALRPVPYPSKA